MVNKYPYTDFHELNLDWFLRQFKTLKAEWAALAADNAEFKVEMTQKFDTLDHTVQTFTTFVSDYFNNLDVQQEINNKLDQMVLDGTLGDLLQPYVDTEVPAAVTAWLDLNVDPVGSAVTIDRTLTISGSAADAKRVGYIKDGFINTLIQVDWTPSTTNGSYIKQDGTGVGSSTKYFRTSSVWLAQNNNRIVIDMTDPSFELSVTWYSNPYNISDGTGFQGYDGYFTGKHYLPETAYAFACSVRKTDQTTMSTANMNTAVAALKIYKATDVDLTMRGKAADAKTVGDKFTAIDALQWYNVTNIFNECIKWTYTYYVKSTNGVWTANGSYPYLFGGHCFIPVSSRAPIKFTMGSSSYQYGIYYYTAYSDTSYLGYEMWIDGDKVTYLDGDWNGQTYKYVRINIRKSGTQSTQQDFEDCVNAVSIQCPVRGGFYVSPSFKYNKFDLTINLDWPVDSITTDSGGEPESETTIKGVLALPGTYTRWGDPVPLIMYCHGYGGYVTDDDWYTYSSNFTDLIDAFRSAGFAVFDVGNTRNNNSGYADWGCLPLMNAYEHAWKYIKNNYNVEDRLYIFAQSMGTCAGYNFMKWYPGEVIAMLNAGPRPICQKRYEAYAPGDYRIAQFEAAFGITNGQWDSARLDGFNLLENCYTVNGTLYSPYKFPPIKAVAGTSDTDFLSDTRDFYQALKNSGNFVDYREVAGYNHTQIIHMSSAGLREEAVNWFNRFRKVR